MQEINLMAELCHDYSFFRHNSKYKSKFLPKSTRSWTKYSSKRFLRRVTLFPPVEETRSEDTELAGMHRTSQASFDNLGKLFSLSFRQSRGFVCSKSSSWTDWYNEISWSRDNNSWGWKIDDDERDIALENVAIPRYGKICKEGSGEWEVEVANEGVVEVVENEEEELWMNGTVDADWVWRVVSVEEVELDLVDGDSARVI